MKAFLSILTLCLLAVDSSASHSSFDSIDRTRRGRKLGLEAIARKKEKSKDPEIVLPIPVPTEAPVQSPTIDPSFLGPTRMPWVPPQPTPQTPTTAPTTSAYPSSAPSQVPSVTPSWEPTGTPSVMPSTSRSPSDEPSELPSLLPSLSNAPSTQPSLVPSDQPSVSAAPTPIHASCQAAQAGTDYKTSISTQVYFNYELLTQNDRDPLTVAGDVNQLFKEFLARNLVDCSLGEQSDIQGLSTGISDTVTDRVCTAITDFDTENLECYFVSGSVEVFLADTSPISQSKVQDTIWSLLRRTINGLETRSLLESRDSFLVDGKGIVDLYFLSGTSNPTFIQSSGQANKSIGTGSGNSNRATTAIVGVVFLCCCTAFFVYARTRRDPEDHLQEKSTCEYPSPTGSHENLEGDAARQIQHSRSEKKDVECGDSHNSVDNDTNEYAGSSVTSIPASPSILTYPPLDSDSELEAPPSPSIFQTYDALLEGPKTESSVGSSDLELSTLGIEKWPKGRSVSPSKSSSSGEETVSDAIRIEEFLEQSDFKNESPPSRFPKLREFPSTMKAKQGAEFRSRRDQGTKVETQALPAFDQNSPDGKGKNLDAGRITAILGGLSPSSSQASQSAVEKESESFSPISAGNFWDNSAPREPGRVRRQPNQNSFVSSVSLWTSNVEKENVPGGLGVTTQELKTRTGGGFSSFSPYGNSKDSTFQKRSPLTSGSNSGLEGKPRSFLSESPLDESKSRMDKILHGRSARKAPSSLATEFRRKRASSPVGLPPVSLSGQGRLPTGRRKQQVSSGTRKTTDILESFLQKEARHKYAEDTVEL